MPSRPASSRANPVTPPRTGTGRASGASPVASPRKFDFKTIKKNNAISQPKRETRATTTRVMECTHQVDSKDPDGFKAGDPTGNYLFVFNPAWGLNEPAKDAVQRLAYSKDWVSSFKVNLKGYVVKVHTPTQARKMHTALRVLDPEMPEALDVGNFADPHMDMITLVNLNLPETKYTPAHTNVTALMLQGDTYALYKTLRELGFDFVRGVHGMEGVNAWVRVMESGEVGVQAEVKSMLMEEGWVVDESEGDAAEWSE